MSNAKGVIFGISKVIFIVSILISELGEVENIFSPELVQEVIA